jgi:hypothetical protein
VLRELQRHGVTSLGRIANALNERNIPTARGVGVGRLFRWRACFSGNGLNRQTVHRSKHDPAGAEAALATWGL